MKRRHFIKTAGTAAVACGMGSTPLFSQTAAHRDMTYEPNQELKSTGLQIRDVQKILRKGEKGNLRPVLREEILDNPDAVFIIYGNIDVKKDNEGRWEQCPDQMERFGRRAAELVFRKGGEKKGQTFIKPNIVGLPKSVKDSSGGNVHPYFIVGMTDVLRDMGSTNNAIGARGALRHPEVVSSGFQQLLDQHKLPLLEAHVQYFEDYKRGEIMWHKNPEGVIARKFPTYRPVFEKDSTFVNIAHAHTHSVGHTTLSIKNLMGIMPRGYGHICDAWCTLDIWRAKYMKHFNEDFRPDLEKIFVRHINEGYKHWDHGGYYKEYVAAGGYDNFLAARKRYDTAKGEARKEALQDIYNAASSWLYGSEMWAQRMMDCVQALPEPYVSMVEGTFARGAGGTVHADFLTVGKSVARVDAVTSWLMGHDPREMPYLRIAKERGVGENDIERIPVYLLAENGVKKVDFRDLRREKLGINIYRRNDLGPQFF